MSFFDDDRPLPPHFSKPTSQHFSPYPPTFAPRPSYQRTPLVSTRPKPAKPKILPQKKMQFLPDKDDEQNVAGAVAKQEQQPSPYDQVKKFFHDFKSSVVRPDREIEFNIPRQDWCSLKEDLGVDEDEDDLPRCWYDASTSKLIIQCMPSPVHETMIQFLSQYFHTTLFDALNTRVTTDEDTRGFQGKYEGSEKIPDLSIIEEDTEGFKTKWVLEVGLSEKYDRLSAKMRLWLKGKKVVRCILVNISETPPYQCPLPNLSDEEIEDRGLKDSQTINTNDFEGGDYGPMIYKGESWVGTITEISWEVWRLNTQTGEPEQVGEREFILSTSKPTASPQIRLDEFLSNPPTAVISPDWNRFLARLKGDIRRWAALRYQEWYDRRGKRVGM